jgi:hypothetical protein
MWAPKADLNELLILSQSSVFGFSHSLGHFRTHASRFDCSRGRPRRERDGVVGGIEEHLRDVIILADQHHLGCRIGVG